MRKSPIKRPQPLAATSRTTQDTYAQRLLQELQKAQALMQQCTLSYENDLREITIFLKALEPIEIYAKKINSSCDLYYISVSPDKDIKELLIKVREQMKPALDAAYVDALNLNHLILKHMFQFELRAESLQKLAEIEMRLRNLQPSTDRKVLFAICTEKQTLRKTIENIENNDQNFIQKIAALCDASTELFKITEQHKSILHAPKHQAILKLAESFDKNSPTFQADLTRAYLTYAQKENIAKTILPAPSYLKKSKSNDTGTVNTPLAWNVVAGDIPEDERVYGSDKETPSDLNSSDDEFSPPLPRSKTPAPKTAVKTLLKTSSFTNFFNLMNSDDDGSQDRIEAPTPKARSRRASCPPPSSLPEGMPEFVQASNHQFFSANKDDSRSDTPVPQLRLPKDIFRR